MGVGTMSLVVLGTLLVAGSMTMLLDAFASYCFRPLEAIEAANTPDNFTTLQ
jgi:hypothetical protein